MGDICVSKEVLVSVRTLPPASESLSELTIPEPFNWSRGPTSVVAGGGGFPCASFMQQQAMTASMHGTHSRKAETYVSETIDWPKGIALAPSVRLAASDSTSLLQIAPHIAISRAQPSSSLHTMSLTPAFRYISATELAAILKSAPGGAFRSWAVIDVRDSDFAVSDRGVRADVVLQCGERRDSPCQQTAVVVNVQPASSLVHPPLSLFGESQCLPSGPSVRRRQADMQGGNIVGAANYPSDSFITSLDDLVKRAQDGECVVQTGCRAVAPVLSCSTFARS